MAAVVSSHVIGQMAHDAIAFLTAMGFGQVDILGFSIGSFIAEEIALTRPALVRRLTVGLCLRCPGDPRVCLQERLGRVWPLLVTHASSLPALA